VHRDLKELLHSATGDSRFVVVVFLDVRGFSSFARLAESSETAVFLKSVYTTILDDYFADASFFKPTGDGLLVILDYDEESLHTVVNGAVETAVRLVEAFSTICADDPMVNFDVPGELGVGLARGAATRLKSDEKTLDYSGRPLNLAARLMDVARPAGVVFSDSLGVELLDADLASRFAEDAVYVKGLAEDTPMPVRYLTDRTVIADSYKRPLHRTRIHAEPSRVSTVRELEGMGNFRFALTAEPLDRQQITLHALHPDTTPSGAKKKGIVIHKKRPTAYGEDADGPFVRADLSALGRLLRAERMRGTWEVKYWIEYAIHDD
jgi:class 3 adenylate cyclase